MIMDTIEDLLARSLQLTERWLAADGDAPDAGVLQLQADLVAVCERRTSNFELRTLNDECSAVSAWSSGGHPTKAGWYVTRCNDGFMKWRAWACGWRRCEKAHGWDGDGGLILYDFQDETWQDPSLGFLDLPPIVSE